MRYWNYIPQVELAWYFKYALSFSCNYLFPLLVSYFEQIQEHKKSKEAIIN